MSSLPDVAESFDAQSKCAFSRRVVRARAQYELRAVRCSAIACMTVLEVKRICQRSGKLSSIGVWLQDFRLRHVYPPWRTMAMGITVCLCRRRPRRRPRTPLVLVATTNQPGPLAARRQALLSLLRQARAIGAVPLHVVCRISVPTPSVVLSSRPVCGCRKLGGHAWTEAVPHLALLETYWHPCSSSRRRSSRPCSLLCLPRSSLWHTWPLMTLSWMCGPSGTKSREWQCASASTS